MTDITDTPDRARFSLSLGNKLVWLRNVLQQGARELADPDANTRAKAGFYVKIGDKGLHLCHRDSLKSHPLTQEYLSALADQNNGAPIDLVFTGDSCIDLSFSLPNASLNELRQMMDSEIRFNSPFTAEASLAFWTSQEMTDGRWHTTAAVTLREPVEKLLADMAELGIPVGMVERKHAKANFVARPDWLNEADDKPMYRKVLSHLPGHLKLTLLSASIFLASALVQSASSALQYRAISQEADTARAALAAQARGSVMHKRLDGAITTSNEKLALTGTLSGLLPDDVWLDQLIVDKDTVTMVGYAPSAAEVTRLLTSLPELTDIRFASPVTRDNTQEIERFRIAATLSRSEQ